MTSSNPTALPIPARSPSLTAMVAATPIWALEDPPVLLQSCAKGEREICCKTLVRLASVPSVASLTERNRKGATSGS